MSLLWFNALYNDNSYFLPPLIAYFTLLCRLIAKKYIIHYTLVDMVGSVIDRKV